MQEVHETTAEDLSYVSISSRIFNADGQPIFILAYAPVGAGKSITISDIIYCIDEFNRENREWVLKKYGALLEWEIFDPDLKDWKGQYPTERVKDRMIQELKRLSMCMNARKRNLILILADAGPDESQRMGVLIPAQTAGYYRDQFRLLVDLADATRGNVTRDRQMEDKVSADVLLGLDETWNNLHLVGNAYAVYPVDHKVDHSKVADEVSHEAVLSLLQSTQVNVQDAMAKCKDKRDLGLLMDPYQHLQGIQRDKLLSAWEGSRAIMEALTSIDSTLVVVWRILADLGGWSIIQKMLNLAEKSKQIVESYQQALQVSASAESVVVEAESKKMWHTPGLSEKEFEEVWESAKQAIESVRTALTETQDVPLHTSTELKTLEDQTGRRVYDEIRTSWGNQEEMRILSTLHQAVFDVAEYVGKLSRTVTQKAELTRKIVDRQEQRVDLLRHA